MSYTEIYAFDKDGNANSYGEVKNAHLGCMAVWQILEKMYLPSLPLPLWWNPSKFGYYYSRTNLVDSRVEMKKIWNLANKDSQLTEKERMVLISTFDNCIVKKEKLPELITAYEMFEGETTLKEQARLLSQVYEDPEYIAVGFGISLCEGWTSRGNPDPDDAEERLPYNIFTQNEHWFLGE